MSKCMIMLMWVRYELFCTCESLSIWMGIYVNMCICEKLSAYAFEWVNYKHANMSERMFEYVNILEHYTFIRMNVWTYTYEWVLGWQHLSVDISVCVLKCMFHSGCEHVFVWMSM